MQGRMYSINLLLCDWVYWEKTKKMGGGRVVHSRAACCWDWDEMWMLRSEEFLL